MLCLSVGHHVPKIQYGGGKTGSMQTVCCHLWLKSYLEFRAHSNKIATPTSIFLRSISMVLSKMSWEIVLYWKYLRRPPKTGTNTISAHRFGCLSYNATSTTPLNCMTPERSLWQLEFRLQLSCKLRQHLLPVWLPPCLFPL